MGRYIFTILIAFSLLLSVLSGCGKTRDYVQATLNREFTLAVGETASIDEEGLLVTFRDVPDDSRCPKDVQCVWPGIASCMVDVTGNSTKSSIVLVQPGGTKSEAYEFQDYIITFALKPYPESITPIEKSEYSLTMTVRKAGGG
jgi:hypothetical protein